MNEMGISLEDVTESAPVRTVTADDAILNNALPVRQGATPVQAHAQEMTATLAEAQAAELVTGAWREAQEGRRAILRFGLLMAAMEASMGAASARSLPRENAGMDFDQMHGWNRGTGLKSWLGEHCPEVNYKTAMGYKKAAINAVKATGVALPTPEEREGRSLLEISEEAVEAMEPMLGDMSIRALKSGRGGIQPVPRHTPSEAERSLHLGETVSGLIGQLESIVRTGESMRLTLMDRRDAVNRLKLLAKDLLDEASEAVTVEA